MGDCREDDRRLRRPRHFRNHVAAALDADPVADQQAEALDEVGIVQGGAADGGAPMKTGVSSATGVSLPVRPTCTVMALI